MFSLVIPIYNAQEIIPGSYEKVSRYLETAGYDYEIIFEDDASQDASKTVLEAISRDNPRVRVFSHYPNQGLGYTLRQLFRRASGDIIIYLDIDLPFGITCLRPLLKEAEGADVVLASRYLSTENKIPFLRKISSKLYYFFCKALFNIAVRDIGSGLVVFKRRTLEGINLEASGFGIHIEIFTRLKESGFRVKEVPLPYKYNGYSTFSILRHGPRIVVNTLRLWLRQLR